MRMKFARVARLVLVAVMLVMNAPARAQTPSVAELTARLAALETKYQRLDDRLEIERLQSVYGHYIERGDLDQVANLFSDAPDTTLDMSGRILKGRQAIHQLFSSATPFGVMTPGAKPKDYLHVTAPITGVVDVAEDGRTAKGRWYALMFLNNAGLGGGAIFGVGVYENEYVKEGGKWKISRLAFDDLFLSSYDKKGWVASMPAFSGAAPGIPLGRGRSRETPFADPMPFHYTNPITGK